WGITRVIQTKHFTGRTPAEQTSFPPAVAVSKALGPSDNEPKPPSFVSPFLPGHRRTDLRPEPPSPLHFPEFAPKQDASLRVSWLRGRLRAACRVDPDASLRLPVL